MICVLIGPPCSGKTTLGAALAAARGVLHVRGSAVLKSADPAIRGDARREAAAILAACGGHVRSKGLVLDNFPHDVEQAEALRLALQDSFGARVSHVLDLEVPMRELESRAAARLVDGDTGLPVDVLHWLGDDLTRRGDDAPERYHERFQRYTDNAAALRDFYRTTARYTVLDGTEPRRTVLEKAAAALETGMQGPDPLLASPTDSTIQQQKRSISVLLGSLETRLESAERALITFQRGLAESWRTESTARLCGCRVRTTRYVGPALPDLRYLSLLDAGEELSRGRTSLMDLRTAYWERECKGDSMWWPFCSPCIVACGVASDDIEALESKLAMLRKKVAGLRDTHTRQKARTATEVSVTYCAQHQPRPRSLSPYAAGLERQRTAVGASVRRRGG